MRLDWRIPAALALAGILAGCGPAPAARVRSYTLGEKIPLGHLIYNVFDTQWLTQLGEGSSARVPEHRFFLVRLSVVNSGAEELPIPNAVLTDENGNSYTELSNGDQVPQWIGFLRHVKPAESVQGNIVFDVPARGYNLKVLDETEAASSLITIPLSFGTEVPEILAPGSKQ